MGHGLMFSVLLTMWSFIWGKIISLLRLLLEGFRENTDRMATVLCFRD